MELSGAKEEVGFDLNATLIVQIFPCSDSSLRSQTVDGIPAQSLTMSPLNVSLASPNVNSFGTAMVPLFGQLPVRLL